MTDERFQRIIDAYTAELGDRDPQSVSVLELLPAIYAAVPDTHDREIEEALRWSAERHYKKAAKLERYAEQQKQAG